MMEGVKHYLHTGTSESTFEVEIDHLLSELENTEERDISKFQDLFNRFFSKLNKYLDARPEYNFYKVLCLFHPRQLPCIIHVIVLQPL